MILRFLGEEADARSGAVFFFDHSFFFFVRNRDFRVKVPVLSSNVSQMFCQDDRLNILATGIKCDLKTQLRLSTLSSCHGNIG